MNIRGEYWLSSSPVESWAALTNQETLKRCLEGCVWLERSTQEEFALKFVLDNSPLARELEAQGRLETIVPQSKAELAGEAQGETMGSLPWRIELKLESDSGGCLLMYLLSVGANGGVDAGDRGPVEKTGRAKIDHFLTALSHEISSAGDQLHVVAAEESPTVPRSATKVTELARTKPRKRSHAMGLWLWAAVLILIGLRLLAYFQG